MAQMLDLGAAIPQEQWNQLRVDLNWAYEHPAARLFSMKGRYHHSYWAVWVRTGRVEVSKGGKRVVAESGEWLFLPTGKMSVEAESASRFILIGFALSWQGKGSLLSPLYHKIWKAGPHVLLEEKALALCAEVRRSADEEIDLFQKRVEMASHFEFRYRFHDWLCVWLQVAREHGMSWHYVEESDERIVPVAHYLEVMPHDQRVDVNQLARSANLSRRQLYRLFQKQYGVSPQEYRDRFKLQAALRDLQSTRKEIKEVAAKFGYNSTSFGIWIKKKTGKTPSQVRRLDQSVGKQIPFGEM
jgi:AraC-like DNA-binding protein